MVDHTVTVPALDACQREERIRRDRVENDHPEEALSRLGIGGPARNCFDQGTSPHDSLHQNLVTHNVLQRLGLFSWIGGVFSVAYHASIAL